MIDEFLTTGEAALELGVTPVRIRAMIRQGRLKAQKVGRDYLITIAAIDKVRDRKTGRPRKKP